MGAGRILAGVTVAAAALVSSSEGMTTARQLKIREDEYTFKVSRFEDEKKAPYRIFFFDHHSLTASSYSFNDSGSLVHFKAGSEVYNEVSVSPGGGKIEFSPQARLLRGRNKKDDDGSRLMMDYYWEDFSCHQCLRADHNLCGPGGGEFGGLTEFCNAVDLSDLGGEGADSVDILCDRRVSTCAKLAKACDLKCDAGGGAGEFFPLLLRNVIMALISGSPRDRLSTGRAMRKQVVVFVAVPWNVEMNVRIEVQKIRDDAKTCPKLTNNPP